MQEDLIEIFTRKSSTRIRPGLSRMRRAIAELALQHVLPPCILVGGTNGKGSTSGILARLLALSGFSCGLYTSPHVLQFNERIQCTHHPITMDELLTELQALKLALSPLTYNELTFFEVTTLLAFRVFVKHRCDFLVLEVGMGGRFDATNTLDPLLSCVVSVDYDHQEWLGSDLKQIMLEKLGIARSGCPLFWGESRQSELEKGLEEAFAKAQTETAFRLFRQGEHFGVGISKGFVREAGPRHYEYELPSWLNQRAPILRLNFSLAAAMLFWILTYKGLTSSTGLKAIESFDHSGGPWPLSFLGRSQILRVAGARRSWDLYLDVCHNVASVHEFVRFLKAQRLVKDGERLPGLISILRDKDHGRMIELLREVIHPFMIFKIDHERSISEDMLPRDKDIIVYEGFARLWEHVGESLPSPSVVCGSFYAVGQVVEYFQASPSAFSGQTFLLGHDPLSFPRHGGDASLG